MKRKRNLILVLICAFAYGQLPPPPSNATFVAPAERAAIDQISAESLQTSLSYLASDALEGRGTPSAGLELAADYIAARFRSAGLEHVAGDSYFQPAAFEQATVDRQGFQLSIASGSRKLKLNPDDVGIRSLDALELAAEPVLKLPSNGAIPPIAGKVVAGYERRYGDEVYLDELRARKPALILIVGKASREPARRRASFLAPADGNNAPVLRIRNSEALSLLDGIGAITVSVHLAKPEVKEIVLRNVAGLLRGSDPRLRNQYLILSAHYDHLGKTDKGIYYGANDNASGTASVMEIGRALAALNPHPRRSIIFMAFFGEEEGLLGSYYYANHPLVPLKDTVADINLEQMGRTDDSSGRGSAAFAFTGPSYSNLPSIMEGAARAEGVSVYTRRDADDFFGRSDNYAFALHGMVAHTIAVAFEYPDYHALSDKIQKIDFANMAKVDRGVAAGILQLADEPEAPAWSNSGSAAIYRNAGR
jgi:hypothetical protein